MTPRTWWSLQYWTQGGRTSGGAWGASALVHVAAILILASVWTTARPEAVPVDLVSDWSSDEPPLPLATIDPLREPSTPSDGPEGGRSRGTLLPLVSTPRQSAGVGFPSLGDLMLSQAVASLAGPGDGLGDDVGSLESLGLIGEAGLGGEGTGDGTGNGSGSGGGFFGIRPIGNSIVYVVDCSRSMNHPHDSDAKTRFRRLKMELVKSIGMMHEDMQFYIVFFNEEAFPMPATSMVYATASQKQKQLEWVARMRADGNTDPRSALSLALKMKPHMIYFLTDGSFDRAVEKQVLKLSQKDTVIHTFAFGNEATKDALRELAERNRGKFHFVP